jgi:hypothetical protein
MALTKLKFFLPAIQLLLFLFLLAICPAPPQDRDISIDRITPLPSRVAYSINAPTFIVGMRVMALTGVREERFLHVIMGLLLPFLWFGIGSWIQNCCRTTALGFRWFGPKVYTWRYFVLLFMFLGNVVMTILSWLILWNNSRETINSSLLEIVSIFIAWPVLIGLLLFASLQNERKGLR